MSLEKYRKKRDFTKSPEPRPKGRRQKKGKPVFVVQEHDATRLHWDFRLEAQGVLKSWAVTRQPTMDPEVRRLAVPTEDHPLEYAKFKGDIPEGQYGAGHVEIWDKGTYDVPHPRSSSAEKDVVDGVERGKLEVVLQGRKLKGAFALVQMKGGRYPGDWLLIKKQDEFARPGEAEALARAEAKVEAGTQPAARRGGRSSKPQKGRRVVALGKTGPVEFTNEDRVMFPQAGVTKGDLLRYYQAAAPKLLPHLRNRPMTLERLPEGLAGKKAPHFWQKNTPEHYPDWIPRARLKAEDGRTVNYVLVNDEPALLYLVNQGTITFHPWFSTVDDPEHPTFVLFDIDPHQSTFTNAVTVARALHEVLEEEGVDASVKTTGKSGLHVTTPWSPGRGGYDKARAWAKGVARRLVERVPEIATTERSIGRRGGKVYVDVEQNARGKHAVPPWVVRAAPEATVSTPLEWKELTPRLDPKNFTISVAMRRLARGG